MKIPTFAESQADLGVGRAIWNGVDKPIENGIIGPTQTKLNNRRKSRINLIKYYDLEDELNFELTNDNLYVLNPEYREESYYWNDLLNQILTSYWSKYPLYFDTGFTPSGSTGSLETPGAVEIAGDIAKGTAMNVAKPFINIGQGINGITSTFANYPVISTLGVGLLIFGGYYLLTKKK